MKDEFKDFRNSAPPRWICSGCGSSDVQTMDSAWFDPNDNFRFIEAIESCSDMDWCNKCNEETTLDEAEPPDDPWGNAYGDPMYWVPPTDDEYWEVRGDSEDWNIHDELKYWGARLNEKDNTH